METTTKKGNPNISDYGHETRFQPGQSGNPAGPPKARVQLMQWVRKLMEEKSVEEVNAFEPETAAQATSKAIVLKAVNGDWQAIKELLDRDEGPVTKKISQRIEDVRQPAVIPLAELEGDEAKERIERLILNVQKLRSHSVDTEAQVTPIP